MKNIVISSFLVLCAGLLGSCNDFLDTPPKSTQTLDQYYQNEEEAQVAANGLYAWLGSRFSYAGYGEALLLCWNIRQVIAIIRLDSNH